MVEFWSRLKRYVVWALLLPVFPVFGLAGTGGDDGTDSDGTDSGNDDDGTDSDGTDEGEDEKTLSQAEFDAALKKRLTRERSRYADYDELKEAKAELEKLQAADLSEKEKLEKKVADLEKAAADAEAKAETREQELNERLVRAEVRVQATKLGFVSPDDAYSLADLTDVVVDEDGTVKGAKKALEALAKEKDYLLDNGKGDGSVGTPPRGSKRGTTGTKKKTEPEPVPVRW